MEKTKNFETNLTVVFSLVAFLALIVSLVIKGLAADNILDAVFNASALVVTIAVFLVARKAIMKKQHFFEKFEDNLKKWALQNKYLIWDRSKEERGEQGKRAYFMVVKPENHVFARKLASEQKCGRFVELPSRKDIEEGNFDKIVFCLNESTFLSSTQNLNLNDIAQLFTSRIREEYGSINIVAQQQNNLIEVGLENVEKTNENAEKLIEMVEFVKEMVLAIC